MAPFDLLKALQGSKVISSNDKFELLEWHYFQEASNEHKIVGVLRNNYNKRVHSHFFYENGHDGQPLGLEEFGIKSDINLRLEKI